MNSKTPHRSIFWIATFILISLAFTSLSDAPSREEVQTTMKKATDFMMKSVSTNGGFLWLYSADLSEQWGEVPARKSQIWVQPPGTAEVGTMLLEAYKTTGDPAYLEYVDDVAGALIWGQHPSGGWNYLIDFDSAGLEKWYEDVASKCWGWEEYYHYYGNATFDDEVTVSAARFLLEVYLTTKSDKYKEPLLKAISFILDAQYENGAWPQRFPIMNDYGHDGHADYTPYYTYNDDVIHGNIMFLLDAHKALGVDDYKKAAVRGMDFYLISQMPMPQAGWALQYDLNMQPAWARSYEPASIATGQTVRNIKDLQKFYKITGDSKYLASIPNAIEWLEHSILPDPTKKFTHATFYEPGTNLPLYAHREGSNIETGRYWVDHVQANFPGHYGMLTKIDIPKIKKEFEGTRALSPAMAQSEYLAAIQSMSPSQKTSMEEVRDVMSSLDARGAWVEDLRIPHYPDVVGQPRREVRGISTKTYVANMKKCIAFLGE